MTKVIIGGDILLREERKKKTKALIIQQAIKLFKQKGYDNVTVEEITQSCGIAKGTFFNYFQKKEHVLLHITDSYMDLLDQIVQKNQEMPIKKRLLHIFYDLLTIYLKYADLLGITLEETIRSEIRTNEKTTNITVFQETLFHMLEEAKENHCLHYQVDSEASASVLVGMFFHTLIRGASCLDQERMMKMIERQLDVVWEGIRNV